MKPVDPTIESLATAKTLLLDPWGLTEADLARALGAIFTHKVDYADLYFQYTRAESWSLEEGIVKTGSFSIEQGVGVRAVSGEKTAFAYSDSLSADALMSSAQVVRTIGRRGAGRQKVVDGASLARERLYPALDPVATLASAEKVALLERIEAMARAADPHIIQVMAGLGAEYDVVMVAGSDGRLAADVRPLVRLSLTVIAERNGRRELGVGGGGGRCGLGYFTDDILRGYVERAVHEALVNLESRPAPAGEMTVVLGSGWPRPRGGFQPQGLKCFLWPYWRAGGIARGDGCR
jgi:TldD protein